jgi:hypothetical protein
MLTWCRLTQYYPKGKGGALAESEMKRAALTAALTLFQQY